MKSLLNYFFIPFIFLVSTVQATVYLELIKKIDSALPIAIVPFANEKSNAISEVIQQDLYNSGRFSPLSQTEIFQFPHRFSEINIEYWKKTKVKAVVIGRLKNQKPGYVEVSFNLIDLYTSKNKSTMHPTILLAETFTVPIKTLRYLSHYIADQIYEKMIGKRGIFLTQLAYVLNQGNRYTLKISDYDGYNPRTILSSAQPIMSPTWAPDGKTIAYVSFENGNSSIYWHDLATGKRKKIAAYSGINGAPAFSPDGTKIALTLTLSGTPNLYIKNLKTNTLQQVSFDTGIDTEAAWAPDGNSLLFTSNRGGTPQIYQLDFSMTSFKPKRITFDGNYNARAHFTPDGKNIVMLHRSEEKNFSIGIQSLASGRIQTLTDLPYTQSPSVAPNGDMIVYSWRNEQMQFLLGLVSSDGRVQLKLPLQEGDVLEPAWSPFLNHPMRSILIPK